MIHRPRSLMFAGSGGSFGFACAGASAPLGADGDSASPGGQRGRDESDCRRRPGRFASYYFLLLVDCCLFHREVIERVRELQRAAQEAACALLLRLIEHVRWASLFDDSTFVDED